MSKSVLIINYNRLRPMENNKLKYYIYARKSSESEDRQALSIEAQTHDMLRYAKEKSCNVLETKTEAKSAKSEGRTIFNEILEDIKQGKVQGLIVWHPDRLSRNAMDAARLIDLLDKGKLVEIVTPSQTFRNTPSDKFFLSMLCSQAKMDNDNKGINVRRGLNAKARSGVYPGKIPTGYISDVKIKGNRSIKSDPQRLPLIRQIFDLMLSGTYNAVEVREIANEQMGFRMADGRKIARSSMYYMLTNPFYCGKYEWPKGSGDFIDGTHEAVITVEEFDIVQYLLGRRGRPCPKKHVFDFTGMIKCAECGASITAEAKFKKTKAGKVHSYIYYHCTKKLRRDCTQGCLEEKQLITQVLGELDKLEIPPEFHTYAMKWFKRENHIVYDKANASLEAQERAYKACIRKLENLGNMRADHEITAEEYTRMKGEELERKTSLESALKKTGKDINAWIETGDEMLTFIEHAKEKFENGGRTTKRQILSRLGSNLLLFNKKLNINLQESLLPMQSVAAEARAIKARLEPLGIQVTQRDFDALYDQNPIVLGD
jgi:site-specific DNA recombinase